MEDEIVVDWRGDGTVGCNLTNSSTEEACSTEERDSLSRKKKGKRKAETDADELVGEY